MPERTENPQCLPTSVFPRLERLFRLGDRLWNQRQDLRSAFPQIDTADYWYWLMWHGVNDYAEVKAALYAFPDGFLRSRVVGGSPAEAQEAGILDLDAGREHGQKQLLKLSKHPENFEVELDKRHFVVDDLETDISNLEAGRARDREQLGKLSKDVENLEIELGRQHAALDDLETHVSNLESERDRDRKQMLELSKHAENLEEVQQRQGTQLAEQAIHFENLEQLLPDGHERR